MSSVSDNFCCYWIAKDKEKDGSTASPPTCICLGTGRFLRSVWVPTVLAATGTAPVFLQTRGTSFVQYMMNREASPTNQSTYEVDVVLSDGMVRTEHIPCRAVFSLGLDRASIETHMWPLFHKKKGVQIIAVGVTEAGLLSHTTSAMQDLFSLLLYICQHQLFDSTQKLCVVNTDNVPNNGSTIEQHMRTIAANAEQDSTTMLYFIENHVVFFNSMVDRITSARPSDSNVPRTEPLPAKAFVVLDETDALPSQFRALATPKNPWGLVIRTSRAQFDCDIALKLRIANGTHTAIAHVMALCQYAQTDFLAKSLAGTDLSSASTKDHDIASLFMEYLDALVNDQILPATTALSDKGEDMDANSEGLLVWEDWRRRLTHPYFGLSTFFITQNGAAKGGIRFSPTVEGLIAGGEAGPPITSVTAFAYAALLRWLTPICTERNSANGIYLGWLDAFARAQVTSHTAGMPSSSESTITYADGLRYNFEEGWYEFRCECLVDVHDALSMPSTFKTLADALGFYSSPQQPNVYAPIIRAYMVAPSGGNLASVAHSEHFDALVHAIATLYARMIAGDGIINLLKELKGNAQFNIDVSHFIDCDPKLPRLLNDGLPLHFRPSPIPDDSALMNISIAGGSESLLAELVASEVASALVIDVHTHLLPPSHGALCLWGIDELLTYHYLVAEYFVTAPTTITPELFYSKTKQEQAELIWRALFVERLPLSEATRGVVTTLVALGLFEQVQSRNLKSIRKFYDTFREDGVQGAERFCNLVHRLSGVRYNIMTNIPFEMSEAQFWRPQRQDFSNHFRSALRIDPFLCGDVDAISAILRSSGYDATIEGARQYLRDWCDTMQPEYMMASTPHDFVLSDKRFSTSGAKISGAKISNTGINMDSMKVPGAFAQVISYRTSGCNEAEDDVPSAIDENSDLLSEVLMKVCEERDLPLALKIGAHRGVNGRLKQAGDGVVAFADASVLSRLCSRFPKVRFLATFLSRENQHEACVLASKFSNLHIYGCWWYCFTPSLVREITQMRIEMLGTAFTAQHSDARVLDQLIYKWAHSRSVIASVLIKETRKLCISGWTPRRSELRREVRRLFGGSYEEFMVKSFRPTDSVETG